MKGILRYFNLVKKDVEKAHDLIWVTVGTPIRATPGWLGVLLTIILVASYLFIQFYWSIISACLRTAQAAVESVANYYGIKLPNSK